MRTKSFAIISAVCLAVTILWLILMVLSISQTGIIETQEEAINSVKNRDWVFDLTYVNAILITIEVTIVYVCLYLYCRQLNPEASFVALIFVPVYTMMNLGVYFSQISILPRLLSYQNNTDLFDMIIAQLIQRWSGSAIFIINNLAYAVLGIPSIVFGTILLRREKYAKLSGVFLILNALACLIGIFGILLEIDLLSLGSIIGGVLFLFALVTLTLMFYKENEQFPV